MVAQKHVHAEHATWTAFKNGKGPVQYCIGVFSGEGAEEHAWGMARFLNRRNITNHFKPVPDGDDFILRVQGNACNNLLGWLADRGIEVKKYTVRQEVHSPNQAEEPRRPLSREMQRIVAHPDYQAGLETIRACGWEGVECGPPGKGMALATDIDDPVQAFQAAFFLNWQGFLDRKNFDAIRDEAVYALEQRDYGPIRIVVQPAQAEKLSSLLDMASTPDHDMPWSQRIGRKGRQGLLFDPSLKR